MHHKHDLLSGRKITPHAIRADIAVADLVEQTFFAYNSARLREACRLFTEKMLEPDVTIGMSLTGALSPAGLGVSSIIPLIENGFVDWIVSTGANLYHDTHYGLGMAMHQGTYLADDVVLREKGVVRIYDIFFDYNVLLDTDAFYYQMIQGPEFQRTMSTAEFHHLAGKYVAAREVELGLQKTSILAAAYKHGVPIYTSSPGDSSIGMNVAAKALLGNRLLIDVNADVNETAAIVLEAKSKGGKSAVLIFGGGSPKNFVLQTEPQLQEVMRIADNGHDYFLQITDARQDTGGLSGATPAEAVSWGKVDPEKLPGTVVCYCDSTIAMPLLVAYALSRHTSRAHKRLFDKREEMMDRLKQAYLKVLQEERKDTVQE